jgi:tetrahydromethanopterin S-methyltransferase subunit F
MVKVLEENSGITAAAETEDIEEYIKLVVKEKEKLLTRNNRLKDGKDR